MCGNITMNPMQFSSDKILNHLHTVTEWLAGDNPFPITVELDLTNKCNHNCPGCIGGRNSSCAELSPQDITNVIAELADLGCKGLIFTGGGEPLCSSHLVEAISDASYLGMDVGLITNGSILHITNCETLLDRCTWIRISLDAGSSSIHQITHGTVDFQQVVANIAALVSLKNSIESTCTIGVGYLTGKGTNDPKDMMDFVVWAVSLGADYAQFRPFLKSNDAEDFSDFTPINFAPYIAKGNSKTEILCSKHKYNSMDCGDTARAYDKCYGHQFATVISATGDMYLCCHGRGIKSMALGNIRENSISDIWRSERRRHVIDSIVLKDCPLLCRANTFNTILWSIKNEKKHVNFL